MHKFLRTMTAAAVAAAMAPAFAADATYNVDVVVVGAGAAGTAAGWAAAEKGLKVVTLEKQAMVGGTGKFSEGIFAVESSMQRNWNYGLTKDEAFQKIMNYGHWRGNAKWCAPSSTSRARPLTGCRPTACSSRSSSPTIPTASTPGTSMRVEVRAGSISSSRSTRMRARRCCSIPGARNSSRTRTAP